VFHKTIKKFTFTQKKKMALRAFNSKSPLPTTSTHTLSVVVIGATQQESFRFLRKQHNYRHERYYTYLKSRRMFGRSWDLQWGNLEKHVTSGHELEAFDNFAKYISDAREEPNFELATRDLKLLDPIARHGVILGMIEKRKRVKDGRGLMQQLRLTVLACECFEDLCKQHKCQMSELRDEDQYHFKCAVLETIRLVKETVHEHPDAIAGGMRVVQLCANVGVKEEERRSILNSLRGFVEEMDKPYDSKRLQGRLNPLRDHVGRELIRHDPPGTQYLRPPQGRFGDASVDPQAALHETQAVRILPEYGNSDDHKSILHLQKKYKESVKNYRYLKDHEFPDTFQGRRAKERKQLFKKDPMTRVPITDQNGAVGGSQE
jgi:hypothetical protein